MIVIIEIVEGRVDRLYTYVVFVTKSSMFSLMCYERKFT